MPQGAIAFAAVCTSLLIVDPSCFGYARATHLVPTTHESVHRAVLLRTEICGRCSYAGVALLPL